MAVCALFDLYQLEVDASPSSLAHASMAELVYHQVYIWRKYYKPAGEGVVEYGWPLSFLLPFLVETAIIMVHPLPFFSDDKVLHNTLTAARERRSMCRSDCSCSCDCTWWCGWCAMSPTFIKSGTSLATRLTKTAVEQAASALIRTGSGA